MSEPMKLAIFSEDYSIDETPGVEPGKKKITMNGTALVFGRPTRNKVFYTLPSAQNTINTWVGRPFLNSHDDSNVFNSIGHIESMTIQKDEFGRDVMKYSVDIDPEEKDFIRKARRKDIPFVSVQVLVDDVRNQESSQFGNYIEADIKEGLELSAVLIPGDWETNGVITEETLAERYLGKKKGENIGSKIKKDNEEETPLSKKPNKGLVRNDEDLSTDNGGALIQNPDLARTIKKVKDPLRDEEKPVITPSGIPGKNLGKSSADIDDLLAKKTNEPDRDPEDDQAEYKYTQGEDPVKYYRKGGNSIPAPLPKGYKIESHSIWKHCGKHMFVAKNNSGNTAIYCQSCGKSVTNNEGFWKETFKHLKQSYEIVSTKAIVRRR